MTVNQGVISEFTVTHCWNDIELIVDIDFSIISVDQILRYTQNHYDCPENLDSSDDAVIEAFLKILAVACFRVCLFDDLTVEGLRAYFSNALEWGAELFPPMDGSKGITIKSFTFDSFDNELFEIKQ